MVLLIVIISLWWAGLFFSCPKPSDLRAKIPGRWESFKQIQATFWLGVVLCITFFVFSEGAFGQIGEDWFLMFGVSNVETFTLRWFMQTFTHNFIHIDLLHLLTNLSFLGLLSLYERRVKAKRFLAVFLFAGAVSSISVLFVYDPVITAGASAGLLGLGAAYFLDNSRLTVKEYVQGIGLVFLVYWMLSIQSGSPKVELYQIDEWGHILGLIAGILFCKVFPGDFV